MRYWSLAQMLSSGVGEGSSSPNLPDDVRTVQYLFNILAPVGIRSPSENGICGHDLIARIRFFQHSVLGFPHPDGRVDPGGRTLFGLVDRARLLRGSRTDLDQFPPLLKIGRNAAASNAHRAMVDEYLYFLSPELARRRRRHDGAMEAGQGASSRLTDEDFAQGATALDPKIPPALLHAFADVESGGRSGFGPSGKPVIAYEGHIFRRLTNHKHDKTNPLLSYKYVSKAGSEWKKNNKDQGTAWTTLDAALALDHDAALQACSWGMFQLMGFNYESCGYDDVDSFVEAMKRSARGQLDAFIGFCKTTSGMIPAMATRNFQTMATLYNGSDYGDYDQRIARAYKKHGGT